MRDATKALRAQTGSDVDMRTHKPFPVKFINKQ